MGEIAGSIVLISDDLGQTWQPSTNFTSTSELCSINCPPSGACVSVGSQKEGPAVVSFLMKDTMNSLMVIYAAIIASRSA